VDHAGREVVFVSTALVAVLFKRLEPPGGGIRVRARPTGECGRHVLLVGFGTVHDCFGPGDRAPGVMELPELGAVCGKFGNLLAHQQGVLRGQGFEQAGEREPALDRIG